MEVFKGKFPVAYGQFYIVLDDDFEGDMESSFFDQRNGICGAADSSVLFFITGLHTGKVFLEVQVLESETSIDEAYEDIVEASFQVSSGGGSLVGWAGSPSIPLELNHGDYRVRYSAKNMGAAEESGDFDAGDIELYRVEIWPDSLRDDRVIKVTSDSARYWHEEMGGAGE
ncbi:MAG: hypothetical protein AAGN66_27010 [Acidobacteriota bacterium]